MRSRVGRANPVDLGLAVVADQQRDGRAGESVTADWVDQAVDAATDRIPREGRIDRMAFGAGVLLGLPLAVWMVLGILFRIIGTISGFLGRLFGLWILKDMFTVSGTLRDARRVEQALEAEDLVTARQPLSTTSGESLSTEGEISSAAIRSLVDRMTPYFVAPLFYYALFGIPGALAYRIVESMSRRWAARADMRDLRPIADRVTDTLNYVPERLSGYLVVASSAILEENTAQARERMQQEGKEAPHSGRAMAAMSGALGVKLEKKREYTIGKNDPEPESFDVSRAISVVRTAAVVAVGGVAVISAVRWIFGGGRK
jgi:adenosylcobinamide-phosphate synthase